MIARRTWALAVAVLVCLPVAALPADQARHPITHEDVWLARRLGGPVLSPDGKWVVVLVTEPAYDPKDQASDLWLLASDGSTPPRRLTASKTGESGATWSPDGKSLAFAAQRNGDEASQIYVLDMEHGGEAQRVTAVSTGARAPVWRPDGGALLFVSDIYPGAATDDANKKAAAERKARKWNAHVFDGFPIRNWDRWLDDRRPTLFVQPLAHDAPATDILSRSGFTASAGFGGQMGSGVENIAAAWTPDGHGVVFAATANRNQAAFADVVQSLWLVPASDGEPKRLTPGPDSYGTPAFTPDGTQLLARMEPATDRVYNAARLVRWPWPDMKVRTSVTGSFDRAVGAVVVAPDSRTAYFLAEDTGRQKLYRVPVVGGAVREVGTLTAGTFGAFDLAGDAGAPVAVAYWESAVNPPDIVRVDVATGRTSPLTRFNTELAAQIDWQPLREFSFTSSRGATIHNFIALPPGFDAATQYPLFVVIHGGPNSQWIDQFVIRWNYHLLAAPGYVVLLTNYTGSTGFGEKFAQAIQGDPLEGPGRELLEAADEAIKRFPFIDPSRQVAGGASYGGHLSNWLAVTTTRFKALVSHAGLFDQAAQWGTSDIVYSREVNMGGPVWEKGPLWQAQNPILRAGSLKTPMLVSVGERDFRVPMNNALQLWSALQRMQVPSRLLVFPDENHWILRGEDSRFFYGEVRAWLAKWLE